MKLKSTLAGVAILALTACSPGISGGTVTPGSSSSSSSVSGNLTYTNAAGHYSVDYPSDWTVTENNTLINKGDDLQGTAFIVPASMYAGTQLLEARAHVAMVAECPVYGQADMVTISGRTYMHDVWSDAGAGNLYTGTVYTTKEGAQCAVLTLFSHRCNLGPDCGPEHDRTFDDTALEGTFQNMVKSFKFLPSA